MPIITPGTQQWDAFVRAHSRAHALQYSAWGTLKGAYGWQAERVALVENDRITAGGQILYRRLPFRLGWLAYVGMGPLVTDPAQWPALWAALDSAAKRRGAAFLKWEPGLYLNEPPPDIAAMGFQVSPQTVQPPRTVILDIADDDERILARMNQGTRRKIRQSLKNEIAYRQASAAEVNRFTGMMQTTGTRNAFGVHAPDYYRMAYDLFAPDHAALFLAEHESDPLAGVMVFTAGDCAQYLYGASSDVKRNLMGSYGVQWAAIQWAKARGCRWYDLWGVPDEDESVLEAQFETRSDGLWGVYGFKRGWGGRVIRSAGAWDRVYNPLIYAAYRLALRGRES